MSVPGQPNRTSGGTAIDRARVLAFTFDGRPYQGFGGDTVASALLASGVRVLGRSFKYHRPRGVVGAGVEEPNALVTVGTGARREPNLRATQVELHAGLAAESQNRWPSLALDVGAVADRMAPLLPAGFYYKTFMWPRGAWRFYERFIRRAAGLGRAAREPDPDHYGHGYLHADLAVVGAGPAGLAAARVAARAGARVVLVEDEPATGGTLRGLDPGSEEGAASAAWLAQSRAEFEAVPAVPILTRTTAFGYYDDNTLTLAERVTDHLAEPPPGLPRHRLWYLRAGAVVLATGAIERPLVFGGNDRPGVMLASAARRYLNQFGVRVGERPLVFTTNDSAYAAARDLARAGVAGLTVVDARPDGPAAHWRAAMAAAGVTVRTGAAVMDTWGRRGVRRAEVRPLSADGGHAAGEPERFACDAVLVSGGWTPSVHLYAQAQGRLEWSERVLAFVPGAAPPGNRSRLAAAGAAADPERDLAACIASGADAARAALARLGLRDPGPLAPPAVAAPAPSAPPRGVWLVPLPGVRARKRFVDLQNDVTADDVGLAVREGYRSVEHLKRYSTLGMGTDQGRLSNLNGLATLAMARGEPIPEVGFTTFRPPFSPVSLGALAGAERGAALAPVRRTPMHEWHVAAGAEMLPVGRWLRPHSYPRPGESRAAASYREAAAVRGAAGIVDVSTLGKIEIQGPDAEVFLERVYANRWRNLRVGRARYGLMLREDGIVFDDGTTTRIAPEHYYMTTTTHHAEAVMAHLEYHAEAAWPELDVSLASVTDQWAGIALAGPRSREVLAALTGADVSDAALPFLAYAELDVAGVPARVFRITFSGELAYEIHVPADFGTGVWEAALEAGAPAGLVPYGTEAMAILRIEKGHVVGGELDGRTTLADVGLERLARPDRGFIGARGMDRPGLARGGRLELVGLRADPPSVRIPRGGQLVTRPYASPGYPRRREVAPSEGHVTSVTYSPALDAHVALALLRDGRERHGESLYVASPVTGEDVAVEVVAPVFVDPEGTRARG